MKRRRFAACAAGLIFLTAQLFPATAYADGMKVVTLGANLSDEQRVEILNFFGVKEDEVEILTITNEDEREQLGDKIPPEQIGTRTFSCALVNPTASGGIQVKTANMNYVTSNMIASTLSTSGVVNCDVLTAAPFEVSGTGALTGVMMAYETASGTTLDAEKKELANQELVTTQHIAATVGQDDATQIVNDMKIEIIRDQLEEREAVRTVVDRVTEDVHTESALEAQAAGTPEPALLAEDDKVMLTDLGCDIGQMHYRYEDVQETLERVDQNVSGQAPSGPTEQLASDSILMTSNDEALGENAAINATNAGALQTGPEQTEAPAQTEAPPQTEAAVPAQTTTVVEPAGNGEIILTPVGEVPVTFFISGTEVATIRSGNDGKYALADKNGNLLSEPLYSSSFYFEDGVIKVQEEREEMNRNGVLSQNGSVLVPCSYADVDVRGPHWALGITLTDSTADNYDYQAIFGDGYYLIDQVDFYYIDGEQGTMVGSMDRAHYKSSYAYGEYLNVEDRSNGVVTMYDSAFNQIATDLSGTGDTADIVKPVYQTFSENGQQGVMDAQGNVIVPPCWKTIYDFCDGYFVISDGEHEGVMDLQGNTIVQPVYDDVKKNYGGPVRDAATGEYDSYCQGGYFIVVKDDRLGFVDVYGTETCPPKYLDEQLDEQGASALLTDLDGSKRVIAADGTETAVPAEYSDIDPLSWSSGLLYEVENDDYDCGLVDWHMNELLPIEYDRISLSGDGRYLLASPVGENSAQLYEVTLPGTKAAARTASAAGEGAPAEAAPTQETAPADAEKQESAGQADAGQAASGQAAAEQPSSEQQGGMNVKGSLESAAVLAETDLESNRDTIRLLTQQSADALGEESPAAGSLQSILIMLDTGSTDGAGIAALLRAAAQLV